MTGARRVSSQTASSVNAPRPAESKTSTYDDGLAAFMSVRPRLFGIAYRMLGSAAEAEDVVQDVWVRWQTTDRSVVRDAAAFLATTTTRLAINVMQSARSRRETSRRALAAGTGRHERRPWVGSGTRPKGWRRESCYCWRSCRPPNEPPTSFERRSTTHTATSRTSFGSEEANARQVVTRARQHVANGRRMPANSTEQRRLLDAFIAAAQNGDVAGLEGVLASSTSACAFAA